MQGASTAMPMNHGIPMQGTSTATSMAKPAEKKVLQSLPSDINDRGNTQAPAPKRYQRFFSCFSAPSMPKAPAMKMPKATKMDFNSAAAMAKKAVIGQLQPMVEARFQNLGVRNAV